MSKKLIRLTESDLHRIIKESVKTIIGEDLAYSTNPHIKTKYSDMMDDKRRQQMHNDFNNNDSIRRFRGLDDLEKTQRKRNNYNGLGKLYSELNELDELLHEYNDGINCKTFALGGGEWSIEVQNSDGVCIKEFVGFNGTVNGEEPSDLWGEVNEWMENELEPYVKSLKEKRNKLYNNILKIKEMQKGM